MQAAGIKKEAIRALKPNKGKELRIAVGDEWYLRLPIKTPLITEKDNLLNIMQHYVPQHLQAGDLIFVSEKIVALTQNRIILIRDIKASPLARFLAKRVRNGIHTANFKGFGHGTARGMELFIREAGYPRVLLAAAVSAITRPLGIKGLFYRISGKMAKSVDCPMSFTIYPYLHYAKLAPLNPDGVALQIKEAFGREVVIVDANYRGVFSLGKSSSSILERFIQEVFRDNPSGQSDEMTPFFIVRKETSLTMHSAQTAPVESPIQNISEIPDEHFYDGYDYADFWNGRDYENAADRLAVQRLFARAIGPHGVIIDIGSGGGRMAALYVSNFNKSILIDPSRSQLEIAASKFSQNPRVHFVKGTIEDIPLEAESADAMLCLRVFHYIDNPERAFLEVRRVLRSGGHLIIEIPNKRHFKARARAFLHRSQREKLRNSFPINISTNKETMFLNHDPMAIAKELTKQGFTIVTTLSVSNFRSSAAKHIVPSRALIILEFFAQRLLSPFYFGPSIYFLVKKT